MTDENKDQSNNDNANAAAVRKRIEGLEKQLEDERKAREEAQRAKDLADGNLKAILEKQQAAFDKLREEHKALKSERDDISTKAEEAAKAHEKALKELAKKHEAETAEREITRTVREKLMLSGVKETDLEKVFKLKPVAEAKLKLDGDEVDGLDSYLDIAKKELPEYFGKPRGASPDPTLAAKSGESGTGGFVIPKEGTLAEKQRAIKEQLIQRAAGVRGD